VCYLDLFLFKIKKSALNKKRSPKHAAPIGKRAPKRTDRLLGKRSPQLLFADNVRQRCEDQPETQTHQTNVSVFFGFCKMNLQIGEKKTRPRNAKQESRDDVTHGFLPERGTVLSASSILRIDSFRVKYFLFGALFARATRFYFGVT
jgi:hypothetical protein